MYAITFIDRCSRFAKIKFTKHITTKSFIKSLEEEWISQFGIPQTILTDYESATSQRLRGLS
jgi:hypothetical protein